MNEKIELGFGDIKRLLNGIEYYLQPKGEPTPCMIIGRNIHSMILSPEKNDRERVYKTDAADKKSEELEISIADRFIQNIDISNYEKEARFTIPIGEIFPEYDLPNVYLRASPDLMNDTIIADIKTITPRSGALDFRTLQNEIVYNSYYVQLVYYALIAKKEDEIKNYYIYFISKQAPYEIRQVHLTDTWINAGMEKIKEALKIFYDYYSQEEPIIKPKEMIVMDCPSYLYASTDIVAYDNVDPNLEQFFSRGFYELSAN